MNNKIGSIPSLDGNQVNVINSNASNEDNSHILSPSSSSAAVPNMKYYKTIIIGPKKSGKSSYLCKLTTTIFQETYYPTNIESFNTFNVTIDPNDIILQQNEYKEFNNSVTYVNDPIYFDVLDTSGISLKQFEEQASGGSGNNNNNNDNNNNINANGRANPIMSSQFRLCLDYEFWIKNQLLGCFIMFDVTNLSDIKLTYEHILPLLFNKIGKSNADQNYSKLCCIIIGNKTDLKIDSTCKKWVDRIKKDFVNKYKYCNYVEFSCKEDNLSILQLPLLELSKIIEIRKQETITSNQKDKIKKYKDARSKGECIIQ
ncbi:uncharacterized protein SCDLUD_003399 [Saccharomycodes ludwigii]|uniref:uncharacterized protein n=1 Tax=Saccharomycodes ludwigii TaxID=36035 RepID=UPI001E846749|nr:hypothetical protein SCDLUD_003399 [Saccharomycodes ludwigii]KAH3900419.1 hypothetical protein SCDLUD_003399 [Saccharomycodes ludwigii]